MVYDDLRDFLEKLEQVGDLIHIEDEVSTDYEIAAYVKKSSDQDGPAIMFERVNGFEMRVLGGLYGSRRRVAMALDIDESNMLMEYLDKERRAIPCKMTSQGQSQRITLTGDQIDLNQLPIVTHFERDCGPYITGGIQIANSPITGKRNVSMHRMLLLDKNHLTVYAPEGRQLRQIIDQYEDDEKPTEIATVIGTDPAVVLASQTRKPLGVDEMEIAGGFRGKAVELVSCQTIGIEIPAITEIVIEGLTIPKKRENDGPFGEYPGTYSAVRAAPVVEVTAITMRQNPIFQICLTGMPMTENHWMMELPLTAAAYEEVFKISPDVVNVKLTAGGTARHHAIVSIKKRHPLEARNIILSLLSANIGIKYVVVVDHDIDINNSLEVEWAINTRVQASDDVMILPAMYSPTLDPSTSAHRSSSKMGIDATVPLGQLNKYEKVEIPGFDRIDLKKYLG